jgi:hypothetical protein
MPRTHRATLGFQESYYQLPGDIEPLATMWDGRLIVNLAQILDCVSLVVSWELETVHTTMLA